MFRLEKKFYFSAAHRLPSHDGKCSRLHGHDFVGTLVVEGDNLHQAGPKVGMLVDYGDMASAIDPIVKGRLDHWYLNESTLLENPTSEELARWIFKRVKPRLPELVAVVIEETCTARCEYRPEVAP